MLTMVFQLCLSAQSRIADLERLSKTFVSLMESGKTRSPLSRGPYTTFDNNSFAFKGRFLVLVYLIW